MNTKLHCASFCARVAAVFFTLLMSSCSVSQVENMVSSIGGRTPSGEMAEKQYDFNDIRAIEAYSGVKVHYTQTPSRTSVVVKAPADVLEASEIKMNGTTLTVALKSGSNFRYSSESQQLHAYVCSPVLISCTAYAGSGIEAAEPVSVRNAVTLESTSGSSIMFEALSAPDVEAEASSGAALNIGLLKCGKADIEASSGASICLKGESAEAEIGASSGASVDASKFFVQKGRANGFSGGAVDCAIRDAEVHSNSGGAVSNNSKF